MLSAAAQKRQVELRLLADRQFSEDAKSVMSTPAGQRLMARLIYDEMDKPVLAGADTVIRAALHDLAQRLEREIQAAAPEQFRQMCDERIRAQNYEAATLRALAAGAAEAVPRAGEPLVP